LEKFNIEKDIAAFIKKEFDKKYNPTWHCIVGKNPKLLQGPKTPCIYLNIEVQVLIIG